ncbi:MAG: preprotein translocase subunit SecE [Alphaproteobacteria bacterium]
MAKTNPLEFVQQVRSETSKVTWPTLNETIVTTVMVVIMAAIAAMFFLAGDVVIKWAVEDKLLSLFQ